MPIGRRVLTVVRCRGFVLAAVVALSFVSGYHLEAASGRWGATPARAPGVLWPDGYALEAFSLADHDGRAFDRARLLGRWTLVVVGYTHCPDACPTALAIADDVLDRLGGSGDDDVAVVLLSVDPERDDAARLREYVRFFDPRFVGVTGPHPRLRELTDQLGATYRAAEPDASGRYAVDHTTSIALVDPRGRLVALFPAPHAPARIAAALAEMRGS